MSQSGSIEFYVTEEIPEPEVMLDRLVQWLGAEWVFFAYRSEGESRAWDLSQKYARDEIDSPYVKKKQVCGDCHPNQLRGLYRPGTALNVDFSQAPRTSIVCKAHALLPESLRGDFNPGSPIIYLGWHDLIDERPDEAHLLARAFLTVSVWGYGTPADDPRYRKDIWNQPFIQVFERELAAIVAPHALHHAVTFSY
jgi:hypothetical protein